MGDFSAEGPELPDPSARIRYRDHGLPGAGFHRDINGVKHFIDHKINSIQNFMSDDMKSLYHMMDVNVYQENIFHTKMMLKDFDLKHYLFNAKPEELSAEEKEQITRLLYKEMQEIYYGRNVPEV